MMKKGMSTKKALAIFVPCMSVLLALMLTIIIIVSIPHINVTISLFLGGRAQKTDAKVLSAGTALCEDIVEEGVVLLKNDKVNGEPALPLSSEEIKSVNVFGWAAYDWMTMAFGSGYSNTKLDKLKLFPALEAAGIEYNETLYNMYKTFYSATSKVYNKQEDEQEYRGGVSFGSQEIFVLREPGRSFYTDSVVQSIKACSDVGLVVIGRTGSESLDLKLEQTKQTQQNGKNEKTTDPNRHYLELSTEEEEMIAVAKETCKKVIVILNTANTMETGFIDDDGIHGALLVGITGLTGVNGLINVLRGEKEEQVPDLDSEGNLKYDDKGNVIYKKNADGSIATQTVKVSPSGRTADTYAYDVTTAPSFVNSSNTGASAYTNQTNTGYDNGNRYRYYIDYYEGIYVGYKWYETADAEGYWDEVDNDYGTGYKGVVQYPFGYGLSYTDFEWEVTHVYINDKDQTGGALPKNGKIEIYVNVHNVGNFPGMDVVQLYYTPQYNSGKIEKAYVNLGAFAKTGVIQPGEYATVKLELTVQSMASYDCYDANDNGHTGYELDGGDYYLRFMKNSHEEADMVKDAKIDAIVHYTIPSAGYDYDTDEASGNDVENRLTNTDGKDNDETIDMADLDGSHESTPVKYLSRENFKDTYPVKITGRTISSEANTIARAEEPTQAQLEATGYGNVSMPTVVNSGLTIADMIISEKNPDAYAYGSEQWDKLINQISKNELFELVRNGYFQTAALPSIGKPKYVDLDGPLGFNTRVTAAEGVLCEFVAYPSATILAQTWNVDLAYAMGLSVGSEAKSMDGLYGWYAPGANIHRNPFCGRNGEYYSEDALLSGKICAGTVKGAKDKGVYSYVKHFVCNDSETQRGGLFTFLTEQTLREIYLKPFEIMIKEGGGNAIMTSMNRLGRVWSGATRGVCTDIVRGEWGFNGTFVTDWVNVGDESYPPYKGIWAGTDIWLANGMSQMFSDSKYSNDAVFVTLAKKVAHDVTWTFVDTLNAVVKYDPAAAAELDLSKGAVYDHTWYWYVALVEVAFAAGIGVMAFFMVRAIVRNKRAASVSVEGGESGGNDPVGEVPDSGEPEVNEEQPAENASPTEETKAEEGGEE